jgi:hypothetical protein
MRTESPLQWPTAKGLLCKNKEQGKVVIMRLLPLRGFNENARDILMLHMIPKQGESLIFICKNT